MKMMLVLSATVLIATNAMAMSSYDAKSLSCESVHQKVAQDGAVVLEFPSHKPGLMMYNRYISNSTMCIGQGAVSRTTIATSDNLKCPVVTCSTATGKGPNKGRH
jgi:hypothetical protein